MAEDLLPTGVPPVEAQRVTPFDVLDEHRDTHPVLVVLGYVVLAGGGGFVIGADGYGSGTIDQGIVAGSVMGFFALITGLAVVRHKTATDRAPSLSDQPHSPVRHVARSLLDGRSPYPRPAREGSLRSAWLDRIRPSLRLFTYGLVCAGAGVGAFEIGVKPLAYVLFGLGGWLMSSAKFRR